MIIFLPIAPNVFLFFDLVDSIFCCLCVLFQRKYGMCAKGNEGQNLTCSGGAWFSGIFSLLPLQMSSKNPRFPSLDDCLKSADKVASIEELWLWQVTVSRTTALLSTLITPIDIKVQSSGTNLHYQQP